MNEFKVHTISHKDKGVEITYHQVLSPAGNVIYDHLPVKRGAIHFCAFLNRGLAEIQSHYEPLEKLARETVFLLTDKSTVHHQVVDLITRIEQTIRKLEQ